MLFLVFHQNLYKATRNHKFGSYFIKNDVPTLVFQFRLHFFDSACSGCVVLLSCCCRAGRAAVVLLSCCCRAAVVLVVLRLFFPFSEWNSLFAFRTQNTLPKRMRNSLFALQTSNTFEKHVLNAFFARNITLSLISIFFHNFN